MKSIYNGMLIGSIILLILSCIWLVIKKHHAFLRRNVFYILLAVVIAIIMAPFIWIFIANPIGAKSNLDKIGVYFSIFGPFNGVLVGAVLSTFLASFYNTKQKEREEEKQRIKDDELRFYVLLSLYQEFKFNSLNFEKGKQIDRGFLSMFYSNYSHLFAQDTELLEKLFSINYLYSKFVQIYDSQESAVYKDITGNMNNYHEQMNRKILISSQRVAAAFACKNMIGYPNDNRNKEVIRMLAERIRNLKGDGYNLDSIDGNISSVLQLPENPKARNDWVEEYSK